MRKSLLQTELRKRSAFDCPEQEAALNVFRTSEFLQLRFARLFRRHALTGQQYNALRILRGHGGEGIPCQEIAAQMLTYDPDMTRLVDRLEKTGFVRRSRTPRDRRVVLVGITPRGLAALADLDGPVLEEHRRCLSHLSAGELSQLIGLLEKARQGVGNAAEAAPIESDEENKPRGGTG